MQLSAGNFCNILVNDVVTKWPEHSSTAHAQNSSDTGKPSSAGVGGSRGGGSVENLLVKKHISFIKASLSSYMQNCNSS